MAKGPWDVIIPVCNEGLQETYHVGVTKDKKTLASKFYFNSLPDKFSPEDKILVPDLEIATGSTIRFVMDELISRGADPYNIRMHERKKPSNLHFELPLRGTIASAPVSYTHLTLPTTPYV